MDIVQRLRDTIINETPARYPDVVEAAAKEIERMRAALLMGVQLCQSGGHGNGDSCPTCHFMREAQKALGIQIGWHPKATLEQKVGDAK